MKKLFTLLFISTLFISCSQDNEVADMEQEALNFEQKLANGDFDNSNLGIYKGLFTTLDGQDRATILITLNGKSEPTVEFSFPDFTKAVVRSSSKTNKGQAIKGMTFNEGDFKFDFNVNEDGTNPEITNVLFKGKEGSVMVAKETSKAPLTPRTGFYTCFSGCENHPDLGKGGTQTFNVMATTQNGANNGATFSLQVTLKNQVFPGTMTQSACSANGRGLTTCNLSGTITGGSGPATVTGSHSYDNDNVPAFTDCSTFQGRWDYTSTHFGRSIMDFRTDSGSADCIY